MVMLEQLKVKFAKLASPGVLIIVGVAVFWLGFMTITIDVMNRNYRLQRQVNQGVLDNQVIEIQNENLRLERAYYKTNEYLELSARALLGKALPGEHLVLLKRAEVADTNQGKTNQQFEQRSNLDQWLDFLSGKHN